MSSLFPFNLYCPIGTIELAFSAEYASVHVTEDCLVVVDSTVVFIYSDAFDRTYLLAQPASFTEACENSMSDGIVFCSNGFERIFHFFVRSNPILKPL